GGPARLGPLPPRALGRAGIVARGGPVSVGDPPRTAVRILAWAVGRPEAVEAILGDLVEELRVRRGRGTAAGAACWFWMQVLWISIVFRIGGRGLRGGAPRRATIVGGLVDELAHVVRSLRR